MRHRPDRKRSCSRNQQQSPHGASLRAFLLFRRICNNVQFPDAQACKFSRDHSNRLIIHSYPAKMSDPGTSWLSGATLLS
jgi:hypothetical protein